MHGNFFEKLPETNEISEKQLVKDYVFASNSVRLYTITSSLRYAHISNYRNSENAYLFVLTIVIKKYILHVTG